MDSLQGRINLEVESLFLGCVDRGLNPVLGVATFLVASGRYDGPAKTFSGKNSCGGSSSLCITGGGTEGSLLKDTHVDKELCMRLFMASIV